MMIMMLLVKVMTMITHDIIMTRTEDDPNSIDQDLIPTFPLLYLIDLIPLTKAKGTVKVKARVFKSLTNTLILSS